MESCYQKQEDNRHSGELKAKIVELMKHVRKNLKNREFESAATCLRDIVKLCKEEKNNKITDKMVWNQVSVSHQVDDYSGAYCCFCRPSRDIY